MNYESYILICLASLFAGILLVRMLLRKARLLKNQDNTFVLKIPLLGELPLDAFSRRNGIVLDEYLDLKENKERLSRYFDMDLVLRYAREFKINYIGTEGDHPDGSWTPGRLASCTMNNSYKGGYNIYVNPNLDLNRIASSLSREMGAAIAPDEVYPFLFLHEIGHTTTSGNQNFYTAAVNYALSEGRRSAKRRKELKYLKSSIEKFADFFALQELAKWRKLRSRKQSE